MSNKEHFKILKQGQQVWNNWRKEKDIVKPNLNGAELTRADLVDFDLSGASLRNANLERAILSVSDLEGADLTNANLVEAEGDFSRFNNVKFTNATLSYARFAHSSLIEADISYARCSNTNFSSSDLSDANFNKAQLNYTILANTILKGAKNLESCTFTGPTILDHLTLIQSGKLPLNFLRGCGLPDSLINYVPELLSTSIPSCFISYSSKDQPFAIRLYGDLQNKKVRCWFAPEDLKIGQKIRVGIDESIRKHDKLLLILSNASVKSEWVEKEVETAMEQERWQKRTILFPIMIDSTVMKIESGWPADIRRSRNIGDFRKWKNNDSYKKGINRLLRDLKATQ